MTKGFEAFGTSELVIKPTVSAGSMDTFRLSADSESQVVDQITQTFDGRTCMVQPFLTSVQSEGEYSLFYFGGEFSHAIKKVPATGDFRSQEEFGSHLTQIALPDELVETMAKIFAYIGDKPLYLRADFVQHENELSLIEVELIEPSLYFQLAPESAAFFADKFVQMVAS